MNIFEAAIRQLVATLLKFRSAIATAAIICAVGYFAAATLFEHAEFDIPAQWNKSVGRLGVEPLYPPNEDIQVGDIFARVIEINDKSIKLPSTFSGKSVLLGRTDPRKALQEHYGNSIRFALDAPSAGKGESKLKAGVFEFKDQIDELPLVVLPDFFADVQANLGASSPMEKIGASIGFVAARNSIQTLKISDVVTYGMPTTDAYQLLSDYCYKSERKRRCTDAVMRVALSALLGEEVFRTKTTRAQDGKTVESYVYRIEVFMISRLYLGRAVVLNDATASGQIITTKTAVAAEEATKAVKASEEAMAALQKHGAQAPDAIKSLMNAQSNVSAGLSTLLAVLKSEAGAHGAIRNSHSIGVNASLPRRVAVAFRSVGFGPIQHKDGE